MKKIVIIGGGAAGMTAGIAAARKNKEAKICILEHKELVGKKLLSTGNGRCNFTNEVMDPGCYYSEHPECVRQVLKTFGTEDTLKFFRSLGIIAKSKNGYYYPRSEQASAVREIFQMELERLGIEVRTGMHVRSIKKGKDGFVIDAGDVFKADNVILAAGGKAAKALGSDGTGYALAQSLGHSIVPVVPGLVQLCVKNHPLKNAAGVRTDGKVTIYENKKRMGADTGEIQITAYGISGIPVFQISRHAAKALYYKRSVRVEIDLCPEVSVETMEGIFRYMKKRNGDKTISQLLLGALNRKLIPCLLKNARIHPKCKVSELENPGLEHLIRACKSFSLEIENTNGFDSAQVSAGGVRLTEINPATMESLCCPGLYLAGELLDVDGICGGYNLQWAWASGQIAGCSASLAKMQ